MPSEPFKIPQVLPVLLFIPRVQCAMQPIKPPEPPTQSCERQNGIPIGHFKSARGKMKLRWVISSLREAKRNPARSFQVCERQNGVPIGHFNPAGGKTKLRWVISILREAKRNPARSFQVCERQNEAPTGHFNPARGKTES